jgi:hypothetical protein
MMYRVHGKSALATMLGGAASIRISRTQIMNPRLRCRLDFKADIIPPDRTG